MNLSSEQLMIGKRLRDFSAAWLRSLRDTLQEFTVFPRNHQNYPLPSDFPFTSTALREKIHWVEIVEGQAAKRYAFVVHLEYHFDTTKDWSPAIWIVRSSAMSILGRVEIDSRILSDKDSPLRIDADFVLEMMIRSLSREQPVQLSSRIIPNFNPVVYPGLPGNIEVFELRTSSGVLIAERARRMVGVRRCSECQHFLPPTGPGVCFTHL